MELAPVDWVSDCACSSRELLRIFRQIPNNTKRTVGELVALRTGGLVYVGRLAEGSGKSGDVSWKDFWSHSDCAEFGAGSGFRLCDTVRHQESAPIDRLAENRNECP